MLKKLIDTYEYKPTEKQAALLGDDSTNLTYKETFDTISSKKKEWSLSTIQKIELLRSVLGSTDIEDNTSVELALNKLKQIIDRDITYITDITYDEYIKITSVTNPFTSVKNNICKDHPILYDSGYEYGW